MPDQTLRERVRERLIELMDEHLTASDANGDPAVIEGHSALRDAILREFAIRPVAWGKVGEDGEVEGL